MADIANSGNQQVIIADASDNEVTVTGNRLDVNAVIDSSSVSNVKIQGDTSGNIAEVNSSGELKVVNAPPTPPAGTDPVSIVERSDVSTTVGDDNEYTITSGKTLTIQRMSGGAESSVAGSMVELYEDPNGDKSVLNLINDIYVNSSSDQKDLSSEYTGDGTRRVVMRRRNFGGGTYSITGTWEGYEE